MTVRTRRILGIVLGFALFLPLVAPAQETGRSFRLQFGTGAEYLSRSLVWDEETGSSLLGAGMGTVRFGIEFEQGTSLVLLAGYGLNNWNGLVFRQLPVSIDYEAGSIGAILLGAEIDLPLFKPGDWEIGLNGRFLASLGSSGEWTLSELNQVGTFDGKADWMRIQAGPSVTYKGFEMFSPFVAVFYDRLWGTFTLNENINPLAGTEEKEIKGQGVIGASLGVKIDPSPNFRLKAEGSLIPYKKLEGGLNLNFGASLRAIFSF